MQSIHSITLASETDFVGWRNAARRLIDNKIAPEYVEWLVGYDQGLFSNSPLPSAASPNQNPFRVPREFLSLCERVILHSDADRFGLLYRLLWRLMQERNLLQFAMDADVARANAMQKAVSRDMHKMKAFVRFREIATSEGARYIAWFEPSHHIVAATAPFFTRRFTNMMWSILTPELSVHWNGEELTFSAGANRSEAPAEDAGEELWLTYYRNIFNPARLKVSAMRAEMPIKYWRNLPEAKIIMPLIHNAKRETEEMIQRKPTSARRTKRSAVQANEPVAELVNMSSLEEVKEQALHCQDCPLWRDATQTVFGEGSNHAQVMIVGEQPGDKEDLAGHPFVGPAGQLLDKVLQEAGIDREQVYVTNAVKHFKFEVRGKLRLHKAPAVSEINACAQWLEREIALIKPKLIIALGATAARALLGKAQTLRDVRGRIIPLSDTAQLLVTVHPSYILRVPHEQRDEEYQHWLADLNLVHSLV